jgi:hypothetical protein
MQQEEPGGGGALAPLDLRKIAPIEAAAASDRLGWGHLLHVKGSYRITAPRLVLSHTCTSLTSPADRIDSPSTVPPDPPPAVEPLGQVRKYHRPF